MPEPLPEWPMFGLVDDVRPALFVARIADKPAALATLYAAQGGSPRPIGTQMVFAAGLVSGYLSGGCVESDIQGHAEQTLHDGQPRRLIYGEGSPWPDIRLLCGARIDVLVEKVEPDDPALGALSRAFLERREVVWVTDGERRACGPVDEAPHWDGAIRRLHEPTPRFVVVGSDPSALAMATLAAESGFETALVRPKGPAEGPSVRGVRYLRDEPAAALAAIGVDPWTYIAVATHDLETDQAALLAALPSPAPYVGLLGARARLPERLERLRAAGIGQPEIARIRAPIGLDIGGKAPWEVAVSVIAEVMALRYARSSSRMSTVAPASTAGAPAGRRTSAPAAAKTLTSEES